VHVRSPLGAQTTQVGWSPRNVATLTAGESPEMGRDCGATALGFSLRGGIRPQNAITKTSAFQSRGIRQGVHPSQILISSDNASNPSTLRCHMLTRRRALCIAGGERSDRRDVFSGANVSAIARSHGLDPSQLFAWRRKALASGMVAPLSASKTSVTALSVVATTARSS
jgi:hypothetical protein